MFLRRWSGYLFTSVTDRTTLLRSLHIAIIEASTSTTCLASGKKDESSWYLEVFHGCHLTMNPILLHLPTQVSQVSHDRCVWQQNKKASRSHGKPRDAAVNFDAQCLGTIGMQLFHSSAFRFAKNNVDSIRFTTENLFESIRPIRFDSKAYILLYWQLCCSKSHTVESQTY